MDAGASEENGMVVLLPGSGGLRTNGREVSPSGLKPNSRKTPPLSRREELLGTIALHWIPVGLKCWVKRFAVFRWHRGVVQSRCQIRWRWIGSDLQFNLAIRTTSRCRTLRVSHRPVAIRRGWSRIAPGERLSGASRRSRSPRKKLADCPRIISRRL